MPTKKYLHNIDLVQNELIAAVLEKRSTAPLTAVDGQMYYNTTDKKIYYYNGAQSAWIQVGSSIATWGNITGTLSTQTDLQNALNAKQDGLSGTGIVKSTAGVITYLTDNSVNWDNAYSNRIASLTTSGTSGQATLSNNVLNIPQYQSQGNYITSLTGEVTASGPGAAAATLLTSAVTGKLLTGINIAGGSLSASDSILTAFGKLQNQINALIGGVVYQGTWNASTNTPALASSTGTKGYYYVVSTPGTTNLNGITDWSLGDWVIFNGSTWEKVDNTDAVISVNGLTGAVSLTTTQITEGTNQYFTSARARAAISETITGIDYDNITGIFSITSGYGIPTTTKQTNWDTAYTWVAAFPSQTGNSGRFLTTDGTSLSWSSASFGTVTSVGIATGLSGTDVNVSGSPVTSSGTITINIPSASASARGLVTTGSQTFGGVKSGSFTGTFSNGSITGSAINSSNISTASSGYATNFVTLNGTSSIFLTTAGYRFGGNTGTVVSNIASGDSSLGAPSDTQGFSYWNIGTVTIGTASTGTHPAIAQFVIKGMVLNNQGGAATVTNYSTLYIGGAATGTSTITNNYAVWVDDGTVRLDGALELQGIPSSTTSNILFFDTTTKRISYGATSAGSGSGTVTTISVVSANGFAGTVANATTTPAITLTTTITGLLKGNGTAISAAVAGTDYLVSNQTITLSGDVTGSGATSISTTIANNAVTNAKLAQVATATFKGRTTAGTGDVEDLSATQATALLDTFTSTLKGLVPASGGGTTNFLRADGTFASTIVSLNGLTSSSQTFANDTNVTITSATSTHTIGWSGQLSIARGGTGASTATAAFDALSPMTTLGDMIYEGSGPTAVRLAGNTTTTKQFLTQTGTGTVSAAPAWSQIVLNDISTVSVSSPSTNQVLQFNGTNWVNATLSGSGITSLNGLTAGTQTFATGTTGTDFNISSTTSTHTFNIPDASLTARGLVTTGSQSFTGEKTFRGIGTTSATTALIVQDSAGAAILQCRNDKFILFGNNTNIPTLQSNIAMNFNIGGLLTFTHTTGNLGNNVTQIRLASSAGASSGSNDINHFLLNGTLNSTSTNTSIIRDLYLNHTFTSVTGSYRGIDIVAPATVTGGGSITYFIARTSTATVFQVQPTTITIGDAVDIVLNTTTGTKFGTSTSQKLSFYNKAPIVQPTTGTAAGTFTANTGTAVNDASTFSGWTIGSAIEALRNLGLLA